MLFTDKKTKDDTTPNVESSVDAQKKAEVATSTVLSVVATNSQESTSTSTVTTTPSPPTTCNTASSPGTNILNNTNKNEKGLPKAMIKPNVLTHVIEGFVIQEANEPFAVTRHRYSDENGDEPPSKIYTNLTK